MAFSRLVNAILARGTSGENYYNAIEENWRWIDLFLGGIDSAGVDDPSVTFPTPADGDACLVGSTPAGAFSARTPGDIARYNSVATAWEFLTPEPGMMLRLNDGSTVCLVWTGGGWTFGDLAYIPSQVVIDLTGTTFTAASIAYSGVPLLRFTDNAAKTLDIDASYNIKVELLNAGTNAITVSASGAQTLLLPPGATLGEIAQNGRATLQLVTTNTWQLSGDVT